jgi:glycosyltransferase involved in cell wall biosynthesis
MRILHAIHSANPAGGGVIEAINQLSRVHQQRGHTVEIVSLDAPEAPWLGGTPLPVRALGPGFSSYGYAPRFASWLLQNRRSYDAVVVNGLWQYVGFAVRRALHGTRTPYVVFPHGMLDPWFKHTYPLKHLKKALYWPMGEYRVLRDARAVLFTSEEERRLARESFRRYRCHETIANLGTAAPTGDPLQQRELFHTTYLGLREKRLLLFLGRLHEKKGCDLLIRAFARVRAESGTQDGDLQLVLAGPCADASYLASLKQLASASFPGEEPPITWTGMITGDLKWGAYRAADVFVLPSHQENFGFSVVEALGCETPVLISNKVNIWREIEQDRAGLIENDDLEGTVRLLQRWLSATGESRQEMRVAALRCFLSRFEIEQVAGKLVEVLEQAAGSVANPSPIALSATA